MFCPKCGYNQTGSETRYCSRCGFQLSVVTGLLSTNGVLPNSEFAPPPQILQPPPLSPKKKGVRQGAKLLFLSLVLSPIFIGFAAAIEEGFPLIVPFTVFFAGLCWMIYSALFKEDYFIPAPHAAFRQQPVQFQPPMNHQPVHQPQLNAPPFLFQPPNPEPQRVTVQPQRLTTSELVQPPSVTEGTTKFFEKEQS